MSPRGFPGAIFELVAKPQFKQNFSMAEIAHVPISSVVLNCYEPANVCWDRSLLKPLGTARTAIWIEWPEAPELHSEFSSPSINNVRFFFEAQFRALVRSPPQTTADRVLTARRKCSAPSRTTLAPSVDLEFRHDLKLATGRELTGSPNCWRRPLTEQSISFIGRSPPETRINVFHHAGDKAVLYQSGDVPHCGGDADPVMQKCRLSSIGWFIPDLEKCMSVPFSMGLLDLGIPVSEWLHCLTLLK